MEQKDIANNKWIIAGVGEIITQTGGFIVGTNSLATLKVSNAISLMRIAQGLLQEASDLKEAEYLASSKKGKK